MHGLTHVQGGPDPVPCCIQTGSSTTYPDAILAHPCLVHYWPCDEASGDLVDRVGDWDLTPTTAGGYPQYGADGPLTELPVYTAVENAGASGVSGSASRFAYSIGPLPPFWSGTSPFAIEFWVYLTAYASSGPTYFLEAIGGAGGDQLGVYLFGAASPVKQLTVDRGGAQVTDPDDMPLNAWQHIVVSYTGTDVDLYRNGSLVGTVATTNDVDLDGSFAFLNTNASAWQPVNGSAAQLAIYDCALTIGEIGDHLALADVAGVPPAGWVLTSDGTGGFSFQPLPA